MQSLIYQVIPLRRVPPTLAVLDYQLPASNRQPVIGEIVHIPFGTQNIQGVIYRTGSSQEKKLFTPKTLVLDKLPHYFTPQQMSLLQWLSAETLTPLSTIALHMLTTQKSSKVSIPNFVKPQAILAASLLERKRIITRFAQKQQKNSWTVVLVPAASYAKTWLQAFQESCTFVHGTLSDTAKHKILHNQPHLIVTTQVGLLLPFPKLTQVVIDQADDDGYFAFDQSPRVDMRQCARQLAYTHGAVLTLLARWQSPTLQALFPTAQWRGKATNPWVLLDRSGEAGEQRRAVIAASLHGRVQHGRTLWLVNRRGEAGQLRCQDCQQTVLCPTCKRPLQVLQEGKQTILSCLQDNLRTLYPETCAKCGSAHLTLLGKGTSAIAATLAQELKEQVVYTDARTPLLESKAHHVVATTAIANYPEQHFNRIVIPRVENFLASTSYRGAEEFVGTLAIAQQHGQEKAEFFCQTFTPEARELHDMQAAITQETKDRHVSNYPPFGTLVILQPRSRMLRRSPVPFQKDISFPLIQTGKTTYIIRVPQAQRKKLLDAIRHNLHDSWEAIVDPPRIPQD